MLRRHALLSQLALSIGTTLTAQSPAPRTADTVLWKTRAQISAPTGVYFATNALAPWAVRL